MKKIAIGTAQFGMPYGIANKNGQLDENEITKILDLAWKNNIDTLDTAKVYGNSEESIGKYIIKRQESSWNVITKLNDSRSSFIVQIRSSTEKLNVSSIVVLAHSAELFLNDKFQSELQKTMEKINLLKEKY